MKSWIRDIAFIALLGVMWGTVALEHPFAFLAFAVVVIGGLKLVDRCTR